MALWTDNFVLMYALRLPVIGQACLESESRDARFSRLWIVCASSFTHGIAVRICAQLMQSTSAHSKRYTVQQVLLAQVSGALVSEPVRCRPWPRPRLALPSCSHFPTRAAKSTRTRSLDGIGFRPGSRKKVLLSWTGSFCRRTPSRKSCSCTRFCLLGIFVSIRTWGSSHRDCSCHDHCLPLSWYPDIPGGSSLFSENGSKTCIVVEDT